MREGGTNAGRTSCLLNHMTKPNVSLPKLWSVTSPHAALKILHFFIGLESKLHQLLFILTGNYVDPFSHQVLVRHLRIQQGQPEMISVIGNTEIVEISKKKLSRTFFENL